MLSIIVCSKDKILAPAFATNIASTVGVEYELVAVDNSDSKYSIYEAYNKGLERSKYPYLCFVHEDVFFHSNNWGKKVISHLDTPNVGFCGLAGRDFVSKVPASWNKKLSGINIIQSDHNKKKSTKRKLLPGAYDQTRKSVITLDGVILFARKDIFSKISFDEQFSGFHGYDFDICIQAAVQGYKNYVIYDILLEHFSRGNMDAEYYRTLMQVFRKWKDQLPLFSEDSDADVQANISFIDLRGVSRLLRKLVRRGLSTNEILAHTVYFTQTLQLPAESIRIATLRYELHLMRLLNFPIYLHMRRKLKLQK